MSHIKFEKKISISSSSGYLPFVLLGLLSVLALYAVGVPLFLLLYSGLLLGGGAFVCASYSWAISGEEEREKYSKISATGARVIKGQYYLMALVPAVVLYVVAYLFYYAMGWMGHLAAYVLMFWCLLWWEAYTVSSAKKENETAQKAEGTTE